MLQAGGQVHHSIASPACHCSRNASCSLIPGLAARHAHTCVCVQEAGQPGGWAEVKLHLLPHELEWLSQSKHPCMRAAEV